MGVSVGVGGVGGVWKVYGDPPALCRGVSGVVGVGVGCEGVWGYVVVCGLWGVGVSGKDVGFVVWEFISDISGLNIIGGVNLGLIWS